MSTRLRTRLAGALAATVAVTTIGTPIATAASSPLDSPFFHYTGKKPLRDYPLGAVLKTRTIEYHVAGIPLPIDTVQILFRTRTQLGRPNVGVTSVLLPPKPMVKHKVVSYQSFYDSLNPADQPSVAIAGGIGLGDGIAYVETGLFAPLLLAGYTINIPDTEGQTADFAAGPEYGRVTLDSLRAISRTPKTGVTGHAPIGMMGYSGGAIATEWAAELASSYAPGVSKRIVGSAAGGVLVEPAHNLHYIDGSLLWSGVMPMALVGIARAFHLDLARYMNPYGKKLFAKLQKASIINGLGNYPGLTWKKMTKPAYDKPEKVPAFVRVANKLIMSTGGTPKAPLFLGQGTGGYTEGTPGNKPGIGAGDGVMIAGDVRGLAHIYCKRGVKVKYTQYAGLSHVGAAAAWLPQAYVWLLDRFAGRPAPTNCASIPAGNAIKPIKLER